MSGRKFSRHVRLHGRYSRVHQRVWRDAGFQALSPLPPSGQSLWLYLMTCPHRSALPGVIIGSQTQIADELGWEAEAFRQAFREVLGEGGRKVLAEHDARARLTVLIHGLRYDPPASPNVVLGWQAIAADLPECAVLDKHLNRLRKDLVDEGFGQPWLIAFDRAFPRVSARVEAEGFRQGFRKGLGEPATATTSDLETVAQRSDGRSGASSSSKPERVSPPPPRPPAAGTNGARPPRSARRGGGGRKANGATTLDAPADDEVHGAYEALRAAHPSLWCWPARPPATFASWWPTVRHEGRARLARAARVFAEDVAAGRFEANRPALLLFLQEPIWSQRLPPLVLEQPTPACVRCSSLDRIAQGTFGPRHEPLCWDCVAILPENPWRLEVWEPWVKTGRMVA